MPEKDEEDYERKMEIYQILKDEKLDKVFPFAEQAQFLVPMRLARYQKSLTMQAAEQEKNAPPGRHRQQGGLYVRSFHQVRPGPRIKSRLAAD